MMRSEDREVLKKIKEIYSWVERKVIYDREPLTPDLAIILMLGYHVLGDIKGENLTEREAKEKLQKLLKQNNMTQLHYTEHKVAEIMEDYPELYDYCFWDIYFIMNYVYITMYDRSYPERLYIRASIRMLEKMDNIKKFSMFI